MLNVKGNQERNVTPVVAPIKRVSIGTELEDLQARLAQLRRQTEVYPKSEPVATTLDKNQVD